MFESVIFVSRFVAMTDKSRANKRLLRLLEKV